MGVCPANNDDDPAPGLADVVLKLAVLFGSTQCERVHEPSERSRTQGEPGPELEREVHRRK